MSADIEMTADEIYETLTRKTMPPTQISIYKCLREARPLGCTRQELADMMRDGNIRGVHGVFLALSQRIGRSNNTDCPEFFNLDNGYYTLRPALWQAIQRMPELLEAIETMTVEEIYAEYEKKSNWLEPEPV